MSSNQSLTQTPLQQSNVLCKSYADVCKTQEAKETVLPDLTYMVLLADMMLAEQRAAGTGDSTVAGQAKSSKKGKTVHRDYTVMACREWIKPKAISTYGEIESMFCWPLKVAGGYADNAPHYRAAGTLQRHPTNLHAYMSRILPPNSGSSPDDSENYLVAFERQTMKGDEDTNQMVVFTDIPGGQYRAMWDRVQTMVDEENTWQGNADYPEFRTNMFEGSVQELYEKSLIAAIGPPEGQESLVDI